MPIIASPFLYSLSFWQIKLKTARSIIMNINMFTHEDFEIYHYCLTHIEQREKDKIFYNIVPLEK